MIGNKISKKITKVSKNSQQNNSETVTNKHDNKIPNERYLSPEERQEIIDQLRSISKLIKVSKKSQQNNLETVINENDKEVPKESLGKLGCLWQYY